MTDSLPTVLIASYLEPHLVERIRQRVPHVKVIYRPDLIGKPRYIADHSSRIDRTDEQEAEWRTLLSQADIMFDFDHTHRDDLSELAPNLKWIQATSAGIGQFVKRMGYADKTDWIFTTASGVHARPLAEFAVMAMLMFAKDYAYLARGKSQKHWSRYCTTELADKTLTIIGLGKIGREVARLAKAFDMIVIGNRHNPEKKVEHVDEIYGMDAIDKMLPRTDFLVLAVPHTPDTENLIAQRELQLIKQGAFLINIARGAVVEELALIRALQTGHLAGAALDVFEVEPLPEESPLWDMPNVIISPHSASTAETENAKITDIFCENLQRFLSKKSLLNVLDTERLY